MHQRFCAHGTATITPDKYDETGQWIDKSNDQSSVFSQAYNLKFLTPELICIYFNHTYEELFCKIDLNHPINKIDHRCGKDHYQGFFQSTNQRNHPRFYISWRVQGPRKDYLIKTFYSNQY